MSQGVIDGLTETERRCGMKLNVEKPNGNENLKAAIPHTDSYSSNNWRM